MKLIPVCQEDCYSPDLWGRGEDPVLMSPSVVALPQSQLSSPIKTELGGGASQGPSGYTAVSGHQQGGVNISCKEDFCLRRQLWQGIRPDQGTRRMTGSPDCDGERPPGEKWVIIYINLIRAISVRDRRSYFPNITNIVIKLIRRSFWHSSEISPILTAISLTRS